MILSDPVLIKYSAAKIDSDSMFKIFEIAPESMQKMIFGVIIELTKY